MRQAEAQRIEAQWAEARAREGRAPLSAAAAGDRGESPQCGDTGTPAGEKVVALEPRQRPGDIPIGDADIGGAISLSLPALAAGRLLIQGVSGAGKSWTIRRVLEQTASRIQQVVVDPEGEFRSLADELGHLHVDAARLDAATLATAARRARESRISLVLDLSELAREKQMTAATAFLNALVEAPEQYWTPCLVAVDEAHILAPFGAMDGIGASVRKASIGALSDVMSRGRKRGLAGIIATQRLARLSKSVASEALNFMIGQNTLDLDIKRAAEMIGWDTRRAFDRLPMLAPGDFAAVGPAFSMSPAVLRVGPVTTRHSGSAPAILAPPDLGAAEAAGLIGLDELQAQTEREEELRAETSLTPGLKAVRTFIRDPAFADAGRVWEALAPLAPDGAQIANLAAHLGIARDRVTAALALLDLQGAVEIEDGAARIARGIVIEPGAGRGETEAGS